MFSSFKSNLIRNNQPKDDLPQDIPRLTKTNTIIVQASENGLSIGGPTPEVSTHTGIAPGDELSYAINSVGVEIILDPVNGSFKINQLEGYTAPTNTSCVSAQFTVTSNGSEKWESASAPINVVILITPSGISIPECHTLELKVKNAPTGILSTTANPPYSAILGVTSDLLHPDTKDIYFELQNYSSNDSSNSTGSTSITNYPLFVGVPSSPCSLVAPVHYGGLDIPVNIVINDTLKYTDQENYIVVVGSGQADLDPDNVRILNIDTSDSSDPFYINIGNAYMEPVKKWGDSRGSNSFFIERVSSIVSSDSAIISDGTSNSDNFGRCYARCPHINSEGECTLSTSCDYDYESNFICDPCSWTLYRKGAELGSCSGVTEYDSFPPCGQYGPAIVCSDPTITYSDWYAANGYEFKATHMRRKYKQQLPTVSSSSTPVDGLPRCTYTEHSIQYYQRRPHYRKSFKSWNQPYGLSKSPYDMPAEYISHDVHTGNYIEGVAYTHIEDSDSIINDKISTETGVGVACMPPSLHYKDMVLAAAQVDSTGNISGYVGCGSWIGGSYGIPVDYGTYGYSWAGLDPLPPLTRYITPFASPDIKASVSISGAPVLSSSDSGNSIKKIMYFTYKAKGKSSGCLLYETDEGLKPSMFNLAGMSSVLRNTGTIPNNLPAHLYEYTEDVAVSVEAYIDGEISINNTDIPLKHYTAAGDGGNGVSMLYGIHGVSAGDCTHYNVNSYNISVSGKYCTPHLEVCPASSPDDSSSSTISDSDGVLIIFHPDTTIKLSVKFTNARCDGQDTNMDIPEVKLTYGYDGGDHFTGDTTDVSCSECDDCCDDMVTTKKGATVAMTTSRIDVLPYCGCALHIAAFIGINVSLYIISSGYTTIAGKSYSYIRVKKKHNMHWNFDGWQVCYYDVEYDIKEVNNPGESSSSSSSSSSDICSCKNDYNVYLFDTYAADYSWDLSTSGYNTSNSTDEVSGLVCTTAVYPFEGPNIKDQRYRSLMYSCRTYIPKGPITLTFKADSSDSNNSMTLDATVRKKGSIESYKWADDKHHCKGTEKYRTTPSSGSSVVEIDTEGTPISRTFNVPETTLISAKPGSVAVNMDNSYTFSAAYSDGSSSDISESDQSSSSDSSQSWEITSGGVVVIWATRETTPVYQDIDPYSKAPYESKLLKYSCKGYAYYLKDSGSKPWGQLYVDTDGGTVASKTDTLSYGEMMKEWEMHSNTLLHSHDAVDDPQGHPTIGGKAGESLVASTKESIYLKAFVADPNKFLKSHNTFMSLANYNSLIDDQLTKDKWNNILTSGIPDTNIVNGTFTVAMKNNK